MPAADSPTILVAHFLKSHGYSEVHPLLRIPQTLAAFLRETNLNEDLIKEPAFTIEKLLDEKRVYDATLGPESTSPMTPDTPATWSEPAPSIPTELSIPLPIQSNVLSVNLLTLPDFGPVIVSSTASRHLLLHSAHSPHELVKKHGPFASPILSTAEISGRILTATMTGALHLLTSRGKPIWETKPHAKHCTNVLSHPESRYVVSAGYDNCIVVHEIAEGRVGMEEVARTVTESQPEGIAFAPLPGSEELGIVYSRRDHPVLYYLALPSLKEVHSVDLAGESPRVFHGASIKASSKDPRMLAVAGSNVPGMKVYFVNDGKLEKEVLTGAEQGVYSIASVVWRADGAGVWVNGDDGRVRGVGVDGKPGKVLEAGMGWKVRALWSGVVAGLGQGWNSGTWKEDVGEGGPIGEKKDTVVDEEILITGGFDKKVRVWTSPKVEEIHQNVATLELGPLSNKVT